MSAAAGREAGVGGARGPGTNRRRREAKGAGAGPRGVGRRRAGAGLAVMADGGDGRLRTAESGGDGGAGEPAGGGMLLHVGLLALVLLAAYRLYLRWRKRSALGGAAQQSQAALLPRMKRRDFSLEQLREFDGTRNPRILLAVNGKVFDVTKGSKFYGPGERRGGGGGSGPAGPGGARGGGGPGAAGGPRAGGCRAEPRRLTGGFPAV